MKFQFKLDEQDVFRIIERGMRDMVVGKLKVEGVKAKRWGVFDGKTFVPERCDYIIAVDIEHGGSDGN